MPWIFFRDPDEDDASDDEDYAEIRNIGSDSGTEHQSRHMSVNDDEYFDDDVDSTKPDTDSNGWFKLW